MSRFEPRRLLGPTGFVATRIGAGDLADRSVPLAECVATLRRAFDAGINVVDTAPAYEDGYSERIVGEALTGRRDEVFLIDKIDHLHAPVAPQLDASLARLGCEHVDLLVFHACSAMADLERLQAPGGGFDQLRAEVGRGRARFVGISSHDPEVLLAALDRDLLDVAMFPIGPFVDRRYETAVLPRCRQRNVGSVCFKTFGAGKLLGDTQGYQQPLASRPRGKLSSGGRDGGAPVLPRMTVDDCVHYTLTVDPDVALLGLSFPNEQDAAFAAAHAFAPRSPAELDAIRGRAAVAIADKGPCWWNPTA